MESWYNELLKEKNALEGLRVIFNRVSSGVSRVCDTQSAGLRGAAVVTCLMIVDIGIKVGPKVAFSADATAWCGDGASEPLWYAQPSNVLRSIVGYTYIFKLSSKKAVHPRTSLSYTLDYVIWLSPMKLIWFILCNTGFDIPSDKNN